jgi:hypothetical protein
MGSLFATKPPPCLYIAEKIKRDFLKKGPFLLDSNAEPLEGQVVSYTI